MRNQPTQTDAPPVRLRRCPADGCEAMIGDGILACGRHWSRVSRETRALVWRSWRAFRKHAADPDQDNWQATIQARKDYTAAHERAVQEMNRR